MSSRLVERGPTITATLRDGPLEGRSIEVGVVEARPPKAPDVPVDDTTTYRYCRTPPPSVPASGSRTPESFRRALGSRRIGDIGGGNGGN